LRNTLEVLSDEPWQKLRKKFPETNVLVEVVKVMEELGELADLTLRINRQQRDQKIVALKGDLRVKIGDEISDIIMTLVILGKDLNMDVWKMLEKKMIKERDRPL
jgi:NTP pyrophosphatase (non-canonical NTP hydrolase)